MYGYQGFNPVYSTLICINMHGTLGVNQLVPQNSQTGLPQQYLPLKNLHNCVYSSHVKLYIRKAKCRLYGMLQNETVFYKSTRT
jgi:hypothetical protein